MYSLQASALLRAIPPGHSIFSAGLHRSITFAPVPGDGEINGVHYLRSGSRRRSRTIP